MHNVKQGDVFHASWGYDQTNCDYYQVLRVTPHTATLRLLKTAQTEGDGWTGKAVPLQGQFADHAAPIRRKIQTLNDRRAAFAITRYASAFPWDGKPKPFTSYA